MADPDTRDEVIKAIKDGCALKSVLKPNKPCPYYGPSDTCHDCMYDWVTVINEVLKLANVRRASYEKEREKTKVLEAKNKKYEDLFAVVRETGIGIVTSVQKAADIFSGEAESLEDEDG